jgi:hypothetical protein
VASPFIKTRTCSVNSQGQLVNNCPLPKVHQLRVDIDIATLAANGERAKFDKKFKSWIASTAGCAESRVEVLGVMSGSVVRVERVHY